MFRRLKILGWNLKQVLIAFDQLVRCLLALVFGLFNPKCKGYADETMSSWCFANRDKWYGRAGELVVNVLMYIPEYLIYRYKWGHCQRSYESELKRSHLPEDYA